MFNSLEQLGSHDIHAMILVERLSAGGVDLSSAALLSFEELHALLGLRDHSAWQLAAGRFPACAFPPSFVMGFFAVGPIGASGIRSAFL